MENLFSEVDKKNYYKPILIKSTFEGNYKNIKAEETKTKIINKTMSLRDYAIFA